MASIQIQALRRLSMPTLTSRMTVRRGRIVGGVIRRHHHNSFSTFRSVAPALGVNVPYVLDYACIPWKNHLHQDDDERRRSTSPFILANSMQQQEDDNRNHRNILIRLVQWIMDWLHTFRDAVFVTLRGTEVILRFSPLMVLTPASLLETRFNSDTMILRDYTWDYIRSALTALGPAFLKLAQWISTRRDVFPPNVCDRLAVLQDKGMPHPWKQTDATLKAAFGEDYAKQLTVEDMIGCGSAAQVYQGTLKMRNEYGDTEYRRVAIKVLHPNLEENVSRDLWFVQRIADFLHSLPSDHIRMLNLPRAVSMFGSILLRQADLILEAENLNKFRDNFYKEDTNEKDSAILFPEPIPGWISKDILVEDLVYNATSIAEYIDDSTEEGLQLRKELASPLLRAFLKMVFLDNFVHCDLHSGNILIQTSTVERKQNMWDFIKTKTANDNGLLVETKRQIVFLDAGIATSLGPLEQGNLKDLFRAVILNEGYEAGRLMVERAKYERCTQDGTVEEFSNGIAELVSEFHDNRKEGLTLGAVRIGSLLSRVLDLCRIYGVEIDPAMSSIIISTLVLEGLGRSLEPKLNLIDFAVPFVLGRGRM